MAMETGYDNNRVYAESRRRLATPVVPLRGPRRPASPSRSWWAGGCSRASPGTLSRSPTCTVAAASVERELGRLKHDYALAPLRVGRLTRVQLHAQRRPSRHIGFFRPGGGREEKPALSQFEVAGSGVDPLPIDAQEGSGLTLRVSAGL